MWKWQEILTWEVTTSTKYGVEWKTYTGPEGASIRVAATAEVHVDASIDDGATIGPRASVGDGSSVGYGSIVGYGSSVGDGATIGSCTTIGSYSNIRYRASIGDDTRIGHDSTIGDDTRIGSQTSIVTGTCIGKDDWWITTGPQGSRDAYLTAVWSKEHGLRWWVGCQHGIDTDTLRKYVIETHDDNPHAADYLHVITFIVNHPAMMRKIEAAKIEE